VKDEGPYYMIVSILLMLPLRSRYSLWQHYYFRH